MALRSRRQDAEARERRKRRRGCRDACLRYSGLIPQTPGLASWNAVVR